MFEEGYIIGISESRKAKANPKYQLHMHDGPEIMLFLEVDAKMIIEDKVYSLEDHDMMIIKKDELHAFYRHVPATFRRIILGLSPDFLVQNRCEQYMERFFGPSNGMNHKIPAKVVKSSGLLDAFLRYEKYSKSYTIPGDTPVLRAIIIEILYLIDSCYEYAESDTVKDSMKPIINYLNEYYAKDITLEHLCKKFYLSKPYLCRAFQKSTGLTVFEYIRKKRFARVKELKLKGMNIGEAAAKAGFNNYTAFYRAYIKEYGKSPKKDLG